MIAGMSDFRTPYIQGFYLGADSGAEFRERILCDRPLRDRMVGSITYVT